VFLVRAEDDGLGVPVGLRQEVGQVAGDCRVAVLKGDDLLEVLRVIQLVGDRLLVAVESPLVRPPPDRVERGDDPVYAVWGEEPVHDPLSEAVGVERVAEVEVGVPVAASILKS
jgi:hypothetical protein